MDHQERINLLAPYKRHVEDGTGGTKAMSVRLGVAPTYLSNCLSDALGEDGRRKAKLGVDEALEIDKAYDWAPANEAYRAYGKAVVDLPGGIMTEQRAFAMAMGIIARAARVAETLAHAMDDGVVTEEERAMLYEAYGELATATAGGREYFRPKGQ